MEFCNIGADEQSCVHLFFKFGFLLLVGLTLVEVPTSQSPQRRYTLKKASTVATATMEAFDFPVI